MVESIGSYKLIDQYKLADKYQSICCNQLIRRYKSVDRECSVNGKFEISTRRNGEIVGGYMEYARRRVIKDNKQLATTEKNANFAPQRAQYALMPGEIAEQSAPQYRNKINNINN